MYCFLILMIQSVVSITSQEAGEFQELWKAEFGVEISLELAEKMAIELVETLHVFQTGKELKLPYSK